MPRSPVAARSRAALALLALAPLLFLGLGAAPRAWAAGCVGCAAPSLADLQAQPSFRLEWRAAGEDGPFPDYLEMDAGECVGRLEGEPEVVVEASWLVLRGQGEVWNCPHSKSVDTITIDSGSADRSDWNFKARLGAELGVLGAKLKTEVEAGRTSGTTVTEVTRVSKQISPAFCHRIAWKGHFEVVQLRAVGRYHFEQRWAWWTKNISTGDAVHAKGEIWVDCGGGEIEMQRRAPIAGHFELAQRGCDAPECSGVLPRRLGMFPPFVPPGAGGDDPPPQVPLGEPDEEPAPPLGEPQPSAPTSPMPSQPAPTSSGDLPAPPTGGDTNGPGTLPGSDVDR